ncbi:MAG: UvrB/UvrC motif-containing protein [Spirochaetales bacterium]|nr:UvrB/UvrC motif-containing protein [Spirochaetales bacterium]
MMDGIDVDKLIKRCLQCGTSLSQLRATKKAGCYFCYNTFDEEINRMTGDILHQGDEGFELKDRLKEALFTENYELAARIRDKLAGISGDELPRE